MRDMVNDDNESRDEPPKPQKQPDRQEHISIDINDP